MKLCINCCWFSVEETRSGFFGDPIGENVICIRPVISPVDGKDIPRRVQCKIERAPNSLGCGEEGKYWEPK